MWQISGPELRRVGREAWHTDHWHTPQHLWHTPQASLAHAPCISGTCPRHHRHTPPGITGTRPLHLRHTPPASLVHAPCIPSTHPQHHCTCPQHHWYSPLHLQHSLMTEGSQLKLPGHSLPPVSVRRHSKVSSHSTLLGASLLSRAWLLCY